MKENEKKGVSPFEKNVLSLLLFSFGCSFGFAFQR
jgi:hypothetical protein